MRSDFSNEAPAHPKPAKEQRMISSEGVIPSGVGDDTYRRLEEEIQPLFTTFESAPSAAPLQVCVLGPLSLAQSWRKVLLTAASSIRRTPRFLVFPNNFSPGKGKSRFVPRTTTKDEYFRVTSGLLPTSAWHYFEVHPEDRCNITIIAKDVPHVVPVLRSVSAEPHFVLFDRKDARNAFTASVERNHLVIAADKKSVEGSEVNAPLSRVAELASRFKVSKFSKRIPLPSPGMVDVLAGSWTLVDLHRLDALSTGIMATVRRNSTEARQGNIEGHSAQLISERKVYTALARLNEVNTICEIGFNMGHSASLWLLANPRANVIMFDLWSHDYSPIAEAFLRSPAAASQFGLVNVSARLTIVRGSSLETVPAFAAAHPNVQCDILSVDGGHTYEIGLVDIANMKKLANPTFHLLFVDDTNCNRDWCVDAPCFEHEKRNTIVNVLRISELRGRRGISVFQYNV